MYAIRFLTGSQAGQIVALKFGKNNLGRAPDCEIKIASHSISKQHACLLVTDDKVMLTDLNSRNGTFVKGVKIQTQILAVGVKFALHDIIFDLLKVPSEAELQLSAAPFGARPAPPIAQATFTHGQLSQSTGTYNSPHAMGAHLAHHENASLPTHSHDPFAINSNGQTNGPSSHSTMNGTNSVFDLTQNFKTYIDKIAMPGIYAVVKSVPYRWAIAGLVMAFVISVTALSVIPMLTVTKSAIKSESLRRAKTIARNLAAINRQSILEKNELSISTRSADIEEGVSSSYIISARDGTVIAPSSKRGEFVNKPFVNEAWRKDQESESYIDSSNLGVAIPINYYNPELGSQSVAAYAVVLYDMSAVALSSIQGFSLFIQTLALALLAGGLLFFLLYKVIEEPIKALNSDLDDALREGRDNLQTTFQLPALEALVSNVNSALSRISKNSHDSISPMNAAPNRELEAANIVRMLPIAALTVNAIDERVISTNRKFDNLVGGGLNLLGRPLTDIPDSALQANLTELLPKMRESLGEIALSEIPFFGESYEINGQAVLGTSEPAYFLITLSKSGEGN
jgi:hypothetical protein